MSRSRSASSSFPLALILAAALAGGIVSTAAPAMAEGAEGNESIESMGPRWSQDPWPAAAPASTAPSSTATNPLRPLRPLRLADTVALPPFAALAPASTGARDELAALRIWNLAVRSPQRNGFSRTLPEALPVRLEPAAAAEHGARQEGPAATAAGAGWLRWTARVRVEDSYRLRLHLARVRLPAAAQLWVYGGGGGPAVAFGRELTAPEGDLWTPSVGGPEITLELALPAGAGGAGAAAFELDRVLEMVRPEMAAGVGTAALQAGKAAGSGLTSLINLRGPRGLTQQAGPAGTAAPGGVVTPSADTGCIIDGSCVSSSTLGIIASYRHAVGELFFMKDGNGYLCSGGLLNDKASSGTPYLLTANHCFSTQAPASSLQVFWDDETSSCNGAAPPLDSLPQSNGATLLASSLQSDFTFVQLGSVPGNRYYLGWTTAAVPDGAVLSRLSFPCPDCPGGNPLAEVYSSTRRTVSPAYGDCGVDADGRDWSNLTDFLYSTADQGATFPGSSGSPEVDAAGLVVGQLLGACGTQAGLGFPCSAPTFYNVVDGAFAVSYRSISHWLNPGSGAGACVPDAATLCIDDQPGDQRFKVQVPFHTGQSGGISGNGNPVALGGVGFTRAGLYWFFSPDNPELLIKVLNGCSLDGHYWVFVSGGTNVGVTVNVTDTQTGHAWTRTNVDGTPLATIQDTLALPCS
jgi:hypothetical protein